MESRSGPTSAAVGLGTAEGSSGGGGVDSGWVGAAGVSEGGVSCEGAGTGVVSGEESAGAGLGAGTSEGGGLSQATSVSSNSVAAAVRSARSNLVFMSRLGSRCGDGHGEIKVARGFLRGIAAVGAVIDIDEVLGIG